MDGSRRHLRPWSNLRLAPSLAVAVDGNDLPAVFRGDAELAADAADVRVGVGVQP